MSKKVTSAARGIATAGDYIFAPKPTVKAKNVAPQKPAHPPVTGGLESHLYLG